MSPQHRDPSRQERTVEIMSKGRWYRVPALDLDGKTIAVRGRWVRKAVIHGEARQESELQDPGRIVEVLKGQRDPRLRADIFTFSQSLPDVDPKYDYFMEWDSVAAIRLHSFDEWWKGLPQTARKNVRRSRKRGVVIRLRNFDDDLVRGIAAVNDASPVRQGRSNYHYGKSLEEVRKESASYLDRSDFICAYVDGELIAFLKLVYQGHVASILNMAVKPDHYDQKPANALIARAVELCDAKGVQYIRYGFFNYNNKKDSSLRDFKISNGFEEVLVPRYFVPITRWGWICMRLRIHHGILGILPTRAISAFLRLRARWYSLPLRRWQLSRKNPVEQWP